MTSIKHLWASTPLLLCLFMALLCFFSASGQILPTVFGLPLSPSSTHTKLQLKILANSTPPSGPNSPPTLILPSSLLNIQLNPTQPLSIGDQVQISFYFFKTAQTGTSTIIQPTSLPVDAASNSNIDVSLPSSMTISPSSIFFAIVHFSSSSAEQYFVTDFFSIDPQCWVPPNSFDDMSSVWSNTCGTHGDCRNVAGASNFTCICSDSYSGSNCEIPPCAHCFSSNLDSCRKSNQGIFDTDPDAIPKGICLCKDTFVGQTCISSLQSLGLSREPSSNLTSITLIPSSSSSPINLPTVPLIILPSGALQFKISSLSTLPRNTIDVSYYYYQASTWQAFNSDAAAQIVTTETVSFLSPTLPPGCTSSSIVLAIIHYTTKPPGDDTAIGSTDNHLWVDTYYQTQTFLIDPQCWNPPSSFDNSSSSWDNKCGSNGACTLDTIINKYQCTCQNSFSGNFCEIEPCSQCFHFDKCTPDSALGTCQCTTGWESLNCDRPKVPIVTGLPQFPSSTGTILTTTLTGIPPDSPQHPTKILPSGLLNIQFSADLGANTSRDTIEVSYYYFLNSGETGIQSFDPQTSSTTTYEILPSLSASVTPSSVLFVLIHYISKPPSGSDSSDIDKWVDTYYVSQSFTIDPQCWSSIPTSLAQINNSNQWLTSCQNGGQCQFNNNGGMCSCTPQWVGNTCSDPKPQSISSLSVDNAAMTVSFSLTLPSSFGSFTHTIFFRIGLIDSSNQIGANGFPLDFDAYTSPLTWLTASFTIQSPNDSIPTSITNSHVIPHFVSNQVIVLTIPSVFGKTLENPMIFLQPINLPPGTLSPESYSFAAKLNTPLSHICKYSTLCLKCSDTLTNWNTQSHCNDFANLDDIRQAQCPELTCPKYMQKDLSTCSCICTTRKCKACTRSTMLYTASRGDSPGSKYGKSLQNQQLRAELTSILGLNTLPLPSNSPPGFIDSTSSVNPSLSTIASDYKPPVGYEELIISPMAYTSIRTESMIITISTTPFSSTFSASDFNDRYNYLLAKLTQLFGNGQPNKFLFFTGSTNRLDISLLSGSNPVSNNFRWINYDTTPVPQLATTCQHPTIPTSFAICPSVSQYRNSPYWSTCSSATATGVRTITPWCIDLFGQRYDPSMNINNWCSNDALFPNFPAKTQIEVCNPDANWDPSKISSLSISFAENIIVSPGQSIQVTSDTSLQVSWSYPAGANPTHSISIYARPAVSQFVVNEFDDDFGYHPEDLDVSLNDMNNLTNMNIQSLDNGYNVLLGVFPASSLIANVYLPNVVFKTQVEITISFNQIQLTTVVPLANELFIIPTNRCLNSDITCSANSECDPLTGNCVCVSPAVSIVSDSNTLSCQLPCQDKCRNNGTCSPTTGKCVCTEQFSGQLCELDLSCTPQSYDLCSAHGSVSSKNGKCTTSCTCFNGWNTNASTSTKQCTQCKYSTFPNDFCDQIGTNSTRTQLYGCNKCKCSKGYIGERCDTRAMYGTITFSALYSGTDHLNVPLIVSADVNATLVRDLALSLDISSDSISLTQILSTTTTSSSFSTFFDLLQSKSDTNAVTFSITSSSNNDMNSLYNSWNNLATNFNQLPISNTDAQRDLGTPNGSSSAYDPVCVPSSTSSCPSGGDPFLAEDTPDPLVPFPKTSDSNASSKTTSAVIAIIVSIVVAVVVIAIIGGLLVWSKKNNRLCFKQRPKNNSGSDNSHLELTTYSETSSAVNTSSVRLASQVTQTQSVYSSGTTQSIDLIECTGSDADKNLPSGWKKMRHTGTNEIIFVNNDLLKSQKKSPCEITDSNETMF